MGLRFSVLASGSSGNASLVEADGFGVLLDAGLGPRRLGTRLAAIDRTWAHIHAVVLTHTHADHWSERTLRQMRQLGIPLYCHGDHHVPLRQASLAFGELRTANLLRDYDFGQPLRLSPKLTCTPLAVSHDDTTCGFRIEMTADSSGRSTSLAYAADLGTWNSGLADAMANVDILGLEFNHDVIMERSSGRSPALILRVLGDRGHLSNAQAADLFREVLKRSHAGRLRHLVQLHLSRLCNRPGMAADAARVVVEEMQVDVTVHTATQNAAGPTLMMGVEGLAGPRRAPRRPARARQAESSRHFQPMLPGWE